MKSDQLRCQLALELTPNDTVLKVIGEQDFNAIGTVNENMTIRAIQMASVDLTVFPAVPMANIPLLLGVDFLRANKIELCIKRKLLIKHLEDGGTVIFYLDKLGKTSQVMLCDIVCRAASNVKIDSGTVKYVPYTVNLPVTQPNLMLMHFDDTLDDGLIDKVHGLTGIANCATRAVIMSATEKTATVKKGQSISTLSSVLQPPDEIESMNVPP